MERQHFTREFKLEAVKLVKERGVAVAQPRAIWECTGICCGSVRDFERDPQQAFPARGN
jgi:transposase